MRLRSRSNARRRARKLALKNRFFESAHSVPKRDFPPFFKAEIVKNLGAAAQPFGNTFDEQVRALAQKGLGYRAIARALGRHVTVLKRNKRVGKSKSKT
jgi:hypothetical protein